MLVCGQPYLHFYGIDFYADEVYWNAVYGFTCLFFEAEVVAYIVKEGVIASSDQ